MAVYKSTSRVKRGTTASRPKTFTGTWQDIAQPSPGLGLGGNPDPRPMKPPGGGSKPGGMRGVVPAAYKAAHQAEWDAANHKERMAMRKAAPHERPATSVKRTRKAKPGATSVKPPKATGKK